MGQSPFAVNRGVILEKYLFDLGDSVFEFGRFWDISLSLSLCLEFPLNTIVQNNPVPLSLKVSVRLPNSSIAIRDEIRGELCYPSVW
jgi:hypothetical protein